MGETNADMDRGVDTETDSEGLSDISRKMIVGGSIAVFGVVGTGLLVYVLERVGPPGAQEVVWVLGYGLTIFALWYLFLRPINLSGDG